MGQSPTKKMWDKFMSEALDETRKLAKTILDKKWHGQVESDDDINQIVIKAQAIFAQKHNYVLRQIHMLYDTSKDGTLEPDELLVITRDSLKALREWMPKMFEEIMKSTLKSMIGKFSLEQVRQLQAVYDEKLPMMKKEIVRWVDRQLLDVESLSQRMFDAMDEDKGGSITTKEFLNSYSAACIEVLDPEAFLHDMEKRVYTMNAVEYKAYAKEQDKVDKASKDGKKKERKEKKEEEEKEKKAKAERRKKRQANGLELKRTKTKKKGGNSENSQGKEDSKSRADAEPSTPKAKKKSGGLFSVFKKKSKSEDASENSQSEKSKSRADVEKSEA